MNRIRVGRLIISGVIALLVFFVVEWIIEQMLGRYLFSGIIEEWVEVLSIQDWTFANYFLNLMIVLASCIMVMWLYAALRPMFGVGTKTALITSGFVLTFIAAYAINETNLGLYPIQITLIQLFYWLVELPAAVVVGAYFYEAG
jgi:hypothetical protein